MQSGNAAHVVADVLVSHRACVAAAPDSPAGKSGNAADIGGGILVCFHIEGSGVAAALHGAQIFAGNAADVVHAGDIGITGTGDETAALAVVSHQAADGFLPRNRAPDRAAAHRSEVFAGQQTRLIGGALRTEGPLHRQILHHGAGAQRAEKTHLGAFGFQ